MAQNAFVQSMKTIAESLIRKAGFDKTRSGKVVGVNSLTNTYSVKVDGHTYNNVRVVNDATYNVGDTVKVNMPVNQPSQLYISGSIFSDSSIGKKIGHAESLINAIDGTLEDVTEIDGHIYQLDITSVYEFTQSVHTGHVYKDGFDVTDASYWEDFNWYLMTSTGKEAQTTGVEDNELTLPIAKYLYGMVLILEWVDGNNNVLLRKQTTLIDNSEIASVETTASNAYELADNTDNYFWNVESGTDTGAHITRVPKDTFIAATTDAERGYNLLAKPEGVALRYGYTELAHFTTTSLDFQAYYNGTLYNVAEFGANGARIGRSNSSHTIVNANGMTLYDGTQSPSQIIANFGTSGAQIGKDDESHLKLDFHSLQMKDKGGLTYFEVKDLRDAQGEYELTFTFIGNGSTTTFFPGGSTPIVDELTPVIDSVSYVKKNSVIVPDDQYTVTHSMGELCVIFNSAPSNGDIIEIVCITTDEVLKSYTIGIRDDVDNAGFMSVAEGWHTNAIGDTSHSEGSYTVASGYASHTEGSGNIANGSCSHAEGSYSQSSGFYSHAEGFYTRSLGDSCHAEGVQTEVKGYAAHVSGYYTLASGYYQTVIGKNNVEDASAYYKTTDTAIVSTKTYYTNQGTYFKKVDNPVVGDIGNYYEYYGGNGKYAFIIGNGVYPNRSNAFAVDWDGYIYPQATKMVDFVVEEGTNNGWTYKKWNNGQYEAWRYYQATGLNMTTSSAGTYYGTSAYKEIPFPSFHVNYQFSLHEEKSSLSSGVWIYVTEAQSTSLLVRYRAHASTSNGSCGGNFYIRGTWK